MKFCLEKQPKRNGISLSLYYISIFLFLNLGKKKNKTLKQNHGRSDEGVVFLHTWKLQ